MTAAVAQRTRPVRVVIIDDTYDLRELLRMALTRGGMEVVGEAGDGLAGIEAVRMERPDVVLLDLSMPVMDGLEALPSIRRLIPSGKIVVLSGFGATSMSERAMAVGADGYLQKGMALKRILEYVRAIVDTPAPAPPPQVPTLTLVPTPAAPPADGTPTPVRVVEERDRHHSTRNDVAVWDALALAPYGVLEVADEPLFRVIHANPAAQRLLDHRARFGTPLGTIAPELTSVVAFNRLDGEASFEATLAGCSTQATMRRSGSSLLIYLDSTTEDVGMLRRAIATTAHEIRGPVAVLCGVAETITLDGTKITETQRARLMSSVTRQARMLDAITADLLTAAEIQRGTLRLDRQPVDLLALIDAVIADRFLLTVSIQVDDERQVVADPMRLEQMLSNLIGNAMKYGRAPFVVRVRTCESNPAMVSIDVVDHGDGVPDSFVDELFKEFSRAAGTVAKGTGLGLYVVRTLAEAQHGEITYAELPEGGAVFTLTLPAV